MTTVVETMIPPMVGTPILTMWLAGPSLRTCLPAFLTRNRVTIGRPISTVTMNARLASASETAMF